MQDGKYSRTSFVLHARREKGSSMKKAELVIRIPLKMEDEHGNNSELEAYRIIEKHGEPCKVLLMGELAMVEIDEDDEEAIIFSSFSGKYHRPGFPEDEEDKA